MIRPGQFAILAAAAESMCQPGVLQPPLDARVTAEWTLVGYLDAVDALFGQGDGSLYYGYAIQNIADPTQYAVVIRGTENFREWLIDADGLLVPGLHGHVEQGFYGIYTTMQFHGVPAAKGISLLIPQRPDVTVTVVGHSLGAVLAAYLLPDLKGLTKAAVKGQLFACPKPGDKAFAQAVNSSIGNANYVVHNYVCDIVPHLPFSDPFGLGFQALPNIDVIKRSQSEVSISDSLECNHSAISYAALLGEDVTSTCITRSTE